MLWWTLRQLKSGNFDKQEKALRRLSDKPNSKAVPTVIEILLSEATRNHRMATIVLGDIGDVRAIEPLVDVLLHNDDVTMRQYAAEALGKIGDPKAVQPLVTALKDPYYSDRHGGYRTLDYYPVRKAAVNALQKIGQTAIEPLLPLLKDKDRTVRKIAAGALGGLGWEPQDSDQRLWYEIARENWKNAVSEGVTAIDPLLNLLNKESALTCPEDLVKELGNISDVRVVEGLLSILDRKTVGRKVVNAIINVLGNISDARIVDVESLLSILNRKNINPKLQIAIINVLGNISDARVVESLLSILNRKNIDSTVEIATIEALAKIGDDRAVDPIIRVLIRLLNSGDIRLSPLRILRKIEDGRAIQPLLIYTKDKHSAKEVIQTIEQIMVRSAHTATPDDLRTIIDLDNVVQRTVMDYNEAEREYYGEVNYETDEPVDLSNVKKLALEELTRRGLSV